MPTTAEEILDALRNLESAHNRAGMARFGVNVDNALGVSVATLRRLAKPLGRDHELALALWQRGIHEARIMAAIVADPESFTRTHARAWVKDFNSWDLCDQCCQNLFWQIDASLDLALSWTESEREFTKRAGYTILAMLAFKDPRLSDDDIAAFLPVIEAGANDERNFVKKAVNWALRQIGKRNLALNAKAVACAKRLLERDEKSAHWIARDALRELTGEKVQQRLAARSS